MSAMTRPDPAPSRLKYRLERLMLTPLFWLVLRVGVPFGLAFGGASLWFAQEPNREAFLTFVNDIRTEIEQRPEFMVNLMAIDGASQSVAEDIREIIPQDFPVSSFELDLERLREIVVGLDAVKSASLRITQGGVLQVDVVERIPALVWRHAEGLELMDATGVMVGPLAARQDRADLPVIAGQGANKAVPEALALIAAAAPLQERMRGLVRMGERRWDVVLDRDQRILLPEAKPVQALERVIAMDQALDLLKHDIAVVDLRLPDRPTVRMSPEAMQTLWQTTMPVPGEKSE